MLKFTPLVRLTPSSGGSCRGWCWRSRASVLAQAIGRQYANNFTLPGTESQRVVESARTRVPGPGRPTSTPSSSTRRAAPSSPRPVAGPR